jgi:flagellar biogenesis protein FliO
MEVIMINFDEEIKKFQPSPEIEQAEDVINNNDLTDITDILKELLKENKENK